MNHQNHDRIDPMKILQWISRYKYQLLLIVATGLCLYFFLQSLQKDHTLDLTVQKNKLLEEARVREEKNRVQWENIINEKDKQIQYGLLRDSFSQANTTVLYDQLKQLPNKYNEKAKAINNYGSDELRDYFRNLPKQPDNDY